MKSIAKTIVLAVFVAGCATAPINEIRNTKISSFEIVSPSAPVSAASASNLPVVKIRFVTDVASEVWERRSPQTFVLGVSQSEFEKWYAPEKPLAFQLSTASERSASNAVGTNPTSASADDFDNSETAFLAHILFKELEELYPGQVLIEPIRLEMDESGKLVVSQEGGRFPPSLIELDIHVVDAYAARFFPLVSIRSVLDDRPVIVASDQIATMPPSSESDIGFSIIELWNGPEFSATKLLSEMENSNGFNRLERNVPLDDYAINVAPLERIVMNKQPYEDFLNGVNPTNPALAAYVLPLISRVNESLAALPLDDIGETSIEELYLTELFPPEEYLYLKSALTSADIREIGRTGIDAERSFLSQASIAFSATIEDGEYGKFIRELKLKEINFEQRQETMTIVMTAAILASGGAALAAGGTMNATNAAGLAMAQSLDQQAKAFAATMSELYDMREATFSVVGLNGVEVSVTSISDFRAQFRAQIFDLVS